MRILIACDKFKGALTAVEACDAIARGIRSLPRGTEHEIRCLPVADGGDGLASTLAGALGGEWRTRAVEGPLGREVEAGYAWVAETRTAIVEMAEASGIVLVAEGEHDPWRSSTCGTGELVLDAIDSGADRILLGIGGSATNDGGAGMARALGYRFLGPCGEEIADLPARLEEAVRIERPSDLKIPEVVVACDVENPLLGESGATRIYGPQKGVAESEFDRHEARLLHLVSLVERMEVPSSPLSCAERADPAEPGSGAAGGLGYGARAFLGASLRSGFDLVSREIGLEGAVGWADFVVTGEGSLDAQSLQGKAPSGVARLAAREGRPVVAFCGRCDDEGGAAPARLREVFPLVFEIRHPEWTLAENLARAAERLESAARDWGGSL